VIDGATGKATATVTLRKDTDTLTEGVLSPQDVEINKVTNTIYVSGTQSNSVAVIDGNTNQFTVVSTEAQSSETRQTGFTPAGVAVNSVTNMIYTADNGSHDMTVIDGKTKAVNGIVPEDIQEPYVIAVNEKTNKVYMGSPTSRSITVVDGETRQPLTIGDLPGKPFDVVVNQVTNKIYFPLAIAYKGAAVGDDKQITGVVLELDGATNKLVMAIAGRSPFAVAVNEKTNTVYVVNREGNTVTVFSPGKD
jgi:DNA-binding beta-propeller fold protein YncE